MKPHDKNQIRTPRHVAFARFGRHWPLGVWLLAIVASVFLYGRVSRFGAMQGVAETIEETVAPLESARLLKIHVDVGDHVSKGDAIAQMDTLLLDARAAVEDARLIEAESQLSAYHRSLARLMRDINDSVRDAELALEEKRAALRSDRARLDALQSEEARRLRLRERRLLNEMDAQALRPEIAALEAIVESSRELIRRREQQLHALMAQRADIYRWLEIDEDGLLSDAVADALTAREAVVERMLERRALQRRSYTLRAANDGVVSQVFGVPGSVFAAGEQVVQMIPERTSRVIGFLPEIHQADLAVGQTVHVAPLASGARGALPATIETIAPEIRSLPDRVSPLRARPLRGRRVVLRLDDETTLTPGESVRITIPIRDRWSFMDLKRERR